MKKIASSATRDRRQKRDFVAIGQGPIPAREFAIDCHAQPLMTERETVPLPQLRV